MGLFSVGGGYAAIPLIQAQVVEAHGWLTMAEFTNLVTIAEMTPGPIAVNSATFVGIRIAGARRRGGHAGVHFPGAYSGVGAGVSVPALQSAPALDSVLSCLRPAVVALIAAAALPCWARPCWAAQPRRRATCSGLRRRCSARPWCCCAGASGTPFW